MIRHIEFEHYRIFNERQDLRLAPLTVLFGKNNTGKSAILKLPLLLHSAIVCDDEDVFLKEIQGLELCNEYRDVVYGRGTHAVGLKMCDEGGANSVSVKFVVENDAEGSHSRLEELVINSSERTLSAKVNDLGSLILQEDGKEVSFRGITPQEGQYKEWAQVIMKGLDMSIDYIGPVRWQPKPYFGINERADGLSGIDGRNAYSYLVKDSQGAIHPLLDNVSDWYSRTFSGWNIVVDNSRAPIYSLQMTNAKVRSNIRDTGFGIQQSLPVVVAACREYNNPTLVVIEEPESHLNPSAHAQIGELLARSAVNNENKSFLVETHSLNLMLRLRTLIAKGELKREDVSLYYVDYDENSCSSKLQEVTIDDKGDVENWPENIFKDTLNEALALRQAQYAKQ